MLDGISLSNLTAPTLLGIAILMMLLGRLLPKSTYNEKAQEAERWRQAYEAERLARATADAQTAQLLELAKTTHAIIVAMFGTAERLQKSGGTDVVPTGK